MTQSEARVNIYKGLDFLESNPHQSAKYFSLLEQRIDEFFGTVTEEEVLSEDYLREMKDVFRRCSKIINSEGYRG